MKRNVRTWLYIGTSALITTLAGCNGGGGSSTSDASDPNDALPVANAGADIRVNRYTPVTLDASQSSKADSYKWIQTEGPTVKLSHAESASTSFTPKSSGIYRFTLEASNVSGSHSDEVIVQAQDQSTLTIAAPTAEQAIAVNQPSVTLAGKAGEHITGVTLTNKKTGASASGVLEQDGSFLIENIALTPGDNLLEVTGTDNTGASATDTILVTYNQSVNFLSAPAFADDSALIGEDLETVVSIAIADNPYLAMDGVTLSEVAEDGSVIEADVTVLYDDGNVDKGDDIAGDGVYSSKVTLTQAEAGLYRYRIAANTGVTEYSAPLYFTALAHLADADIQAAGTAVETAVNNHLPALNVQFSEEQFEAFKQAMLAELAGQPGVLSATMSADGHSIVIKFESGLVHTVDFVHADTKSGGRYDPVVAARKLANSSQPELLYQQSGVQPQLSLMPNLQSLASTAASTALTLDDSIGSYRALALSPFKSDFGPYDDVDGAYALIQQSSTPAFTASAPLLEEAVEVASFKNLSQYGVVIISSHGNLAGTDPVIAISEVATPLKQKLYYKDIHAGRLMLSHAVTVSSSGNGSLFISDRQPDETFKITPSFITRYNHGMPNTLVYMSTCYGGANNALADAFINAGAGAFVGYTDLVDTNYAFWAGQTFFDSLLTGKSVKQALKEATDEHGSTDGGQTPAAFVYHGNGNLVLEGSGIRNGGFEQNLKYWAQNGGDIRVLSKLNNLSPLEGSYMAILSSGLGSINDSEAIIEQQFKIPSDVNFVTFDYNIISEEPMEFVGSEYDDKFEAVLVDQNGNEIELAFESLNEALWNAIGGSQPDGGMFDGGDETAFHTGWKRIDYPITSLAGQTVTLRFRVWDVGDSIYDTAALIDNIALQ